jgi:adenosylcobyric acid synthase
MPPLAGLRGSLFVVGTASGAGKSTIVAGLCRVLARAGVRVAPFKALNMSNNAVVATDGGEIARAQHAQAVAAGVDPVSAMNPVLVKPLDDTTSQFVVRGRAQPVGTRPEPSVLLATARDAFEELRARFDVVVAEGAGAAAELNLLERDVVNLPLAARVGAPAVLVADVDRGGMIASVYGTVALLPDELRAPLAGVLVNRFRGDRALLARALRAVEDRTGLPVLGVVRAFDRRPVESEDSLDLDAVTADADGDAIDVAVVRFPHVSNWSDVEPLAADPAARVRLVASSAALGDPDLVVLPGSRSVMADLAWLRTTGLARAIEARDAFVLAVCGGYQMAGRRIRDTGGVEAPGDVAGLAWLPVVTEFGPEKVVRWHRGRALGETVTGYEIRHGRPRRVGGDGWVVLADGSCEGAWSGRVAGTSLHGLFEHDGFRRAFLGTVAAHRGRALDAPAFSYPVERTRRLDALADAILEDVDLGALAAVVARGAVVGAGR